MEAKFSGAGDMDKYMDKLKNMESKLDTGGMDQMMEKINQLSKQADMMGGMAGKKDRQEFSDDDSEEGGPVMIDTTGKGKKRRN